MRREQHVSGGADRLSARLQAGTNTGAVPEGTALWDSSPVGSRDPGGRQPEPEPGSVSCDRSEATRNKACLH
jgi:hypothetical protein